jgi:outer membrane protein assembly factor BamB
MDPVDANWNIGTDSSFSRGGWLMQSNLPMLVLVFLAQCATAGDNWPQFRGPAGDGVSDAVGLPLTWSETENIAWKTPIHDRGWSSPVIWGTQIWLTTATEDGKRLFAVCVDQDSGIVTHDVKVFDVTKPESIAKVNSYASPTPVIEDGRVYVHYGTYGTACLNTQTGEILWTRRDLNCDHHMGPGASPILHEDLIIFTVDGCDVQYVVALDKKTGKTTWKTDRSVDLSGVHYMTRKCYGTPTVYRAGDRLEMITPGSRALFAYDPQNGRELWKLRHRGWSISPRPVYHEGLLYVVTDFDHPELWAIKPGGSGERSEDAIIWRLRKGVPSTPSFLLVGGTVLFVNDHGIAMCLDTKSGEMIWRERLVGNFSASPICAGQRAYFFNHDGVATVIEASRQFSVLARNCVDGEMRASPAISGRSLFLRTNTHLYRIEELHSTN